MMTARHRCPGRCGKSLPIWLDICRDCDRRDTDTLALTAGARWPSPCGVCGHAVAPGRIADGSDLCSYCDDRKARL